MERIILKNLHYYEDYVRQVLPFLKKDYFEEQSSKVIFDILKNYYNKYDSLPTESAVSIEVTKKSLPQQIFDDVNDTLKDLQNNKNIIEDIDWLLEQTEEFCQDKALYLALTEAIAISDGDKKLSKTAIPDIMTEALAVSFDNNIAHDYFRDADQRFDYYTNKETKIPSHLTMLNTITNGGVEKKAVNCLMGGTGAGKTRQLCDFAARYIESGYNVLYVTLEMGQEKIAQRIDANLLDVDINEVPKLQRKTFLKKINRIKKRFHGRFLVREYPTGEASVIHFKHLIKELKQKENFVPDIVIIDYMNICASAKHDKKSDSYGYIKSICEEIRALAKEMEICIWTATQANRQGNNNSDMDMSNTSESFGGPMTFDFFIALISTQELASLNQIMIKQLKNRYGDVNKNTKFVIGVDPDKMRTYDLNNSNIQAQLPQTQTNPHLPTKTNVAKKFHGINF